MSHFLYGFDHAGETFQGQAPGGAGDADGRHAAVAIIKDRHGDAAHTRVVFFVIHGIALVIDLLDMVLDGCRFGDGSESVALRLLRDGCAGESQQHLAQGRAVQWSQGTHPGGDAQR